MSEQAIQAKYDDIASRYDRAVSPRQLHTFLPRNVQIPYHEVLKYLRETNQLAEQYKDEKCTCWMCK